MSHIFYVEQECFVWVILLGVRVFSRNVEWELAFMGRENVKNIQKTNKIC